MGGAAVLGDAQGAEGDAIDDAVVKHDDAVREELEEVVFRRGALARVGLGRDERRGPALVRPVAEAKGLASDEPRAVEVAEQDVEPVEDDAPRADLLRLGRDRRQEPEQVELAPLLDGLAELRVKHVDALGSERRPSPVEAHGVGQDPVSALFERDEDPGLPTAGALREHLEAEDCLAGAGPANHHRDAGPG